MCITAAYRPVRELIQQESLKDKVFSSEPFPLQLNLLFYLTTFDTKQSIMFFLQEKKKTEAESKSSEDSSETLKEENKEEQVITLRSLLMEDMRQAKNQVI